MESISHDHIIPTAAAAADDDDILQDLTFHELNFFPLPAQSNTYGLTSIETNGGGGQSKLLVATLSGEIFRLEVDPQSLQFSWKSITFSYIPAEAEVISLDAFTQEPNGLVVGVTLIKATNSREIYFNIYGVHVNPHSTVLKWEQIAEDWTPINLLFVPYKLSHSLILTNSDNWETIFLLSGDDMKFHMYKQINTSNELTYQEELSIGEYFPELVNLPSVVMDYNITIRDGHRYTVYGCQDGTVKCFMVDVITNNVLKCMSSDYFDGPITSVNLFNSSSSSEVVNHLLVTLSLNPSAAVYKDIFNGDGSCNDPLILPSSHHHDSISCSALADLTFANQSELIIGSYGKVLLIYKVAHRDTVETLDFQLIWEREFAHPIYRIWVGDVTGDGLNEMVVLTSAGIHILQHDLQQVYRLCMSRIDNAK